MKSRMLRLWISVIESGILKMATDSDEDRGMHQGTFTVVSPWFTEHQLLLRLEHEHDVIRIDRSQLGVLARNYV